MGCTLFEIINIDSITWYSVGFLNLSITNENINVVNLKLQKVLDEIKMTMFKSSRGSTIFLGKSHISYVSIIIISPWPFIYNLYINYIFHSFPINTRIYNTKITSCYQSKWSRGYRNSNTASGCYSEVCGSNPLNSIVHLFHVNIFLF